MSCHQIQQNPNKSDPDASEIWASKNPSGPEKYKNKSRTHWPSTIVAVIVGLGPGGLGLLGFLPNQQLTISWDQLWKKKHQYFVMLRTSEVSLCPTWMYSPYPSLSMNSNCPCVKSQELQFLVEKRKDTTWKFKISDTKNDVLENISFQTWLFWISITISNFGSALAAKTPHNHKITTWKQVAEVKLMRIHTEQQVKNKSPTWMCQEVRING